MLYCLGGASRSGKSKLARRLLRERHVPYLSTDVLMMGLANGLPELGIDPDDSSIVRGEQMWPLLRAMAVNVIETEVTYLLEGDVLLPKHAVELIQTHGNVVRACFIGYARVAPRDKLRDIRAFGGEPNDWLQAYTDDYILSLIDSMADFSRYLQRECAKYGLAYFDNSHDFAGALDNAFRYLSAL